MSGQFSPSHTRLVFQLCKGAYLIHSDVLVAYMRLILEEGCLIEDDCYNISERNQGDEDPSVKESELCYQL